METKDHLYLAKLITGTSGFSGKIKKTAFEYGCIYPDINPLTYLKGHTYSGTASYVKNVITKLFGRLKTPADYFDLGQAVHFIGDYFTFPHTPSFSGTLSEHISYEHSLHEHITSSDCSITPENCIPLKTPAKCIKLLDKLIDKRSNIKNNVSDDWKNISFICTTIAVSALN